MEWRRTRDPYRIWISEVMLQQTRVSTVVAYYRRFLEKFPDVFSLARAPLDEVLSAWEGLGYYSRARNLHRAAARIVNLHAGNLPSTVPELSELPGVGRSTAGAIAAIAFGRDVPILDANARRVVARLFGVEGDLRAAGAETVLWERSGWLVRKGKGRDTALAVMDLGATICLPRAPRCGVCPVRKFCSAFRKGLQERIPPRRPGKCVPHFDVVVGLIRNGNEELYLRRRPPEGLLGGLWAFPGGKMAPGETPDAALGRILREKLGIRVVIQRKVGAVRHAYTHFRITLHGYLCVAEGGDLPAGEDGGWLPAGRKGGYAMPRADRKLIELLRFQGEGS